MRTLIIITLILSCFLSSKAENIDYKPEIGGVVRTRWEVLTHSGDNRFEVRNARVYVKGNIAPQLSYFVRTDFCAAGKFVFLDAWAKVKVADGLDLQAGQFRIPFGVDPFKMPGTYIFANRSFLGKDIANYRAVGLQGAYAPKFAPITIKTGVFSPNTITDHTKWSNKMTYAVKVESSLGHFKPTIGFQTLSPDSLRFNMLDAALSYNIGDFTVEGEYMYKHYTSDAVHPCHAYNLWADYGIPLKKGLFRRLSFQGRWEGNTAHYRAYRIPGTDLSLQNPKRERLTLGATLSAPFLKRARAALHLNYEKYFYHDHYTPVESLTDKILAELVIVF